MKSITIIMFILLLVGCGPIARWAEKPVTNQSEPNIISAVYLVQDQGQLAASDLRNHPKVLVTNSFNVFKRHSQAKVASGLTRMLFP